MCVCVVAGDFFEVSFFFSLTLFIMAVPRVHQSAFTPGEIEFVAGNEKITIIPKAKMSKMSLVQACLFFLLVQDGWTKPFFFNFTGKIGTLSTSFNS